MRSKSAIKIAQKVVLNFSSSPTLFNLPAFMDKLPKEDSKALQDAIEQTNNLAESQKKELSNNNKDDLPREIPMTLKCITCGRQFDPTKGHQH